jgi:hypothetical protein
MKVPNVARGNPMSDNIPQLACVKVRCSDGHETTFHPKDKIPSRIRCAFRIDGTRCRKPCKVIEEIKAPKKITPPDRDVHKDIVPVKAISKSVDEFINKPWSLEWHLSQIKNEKTRETLELISSLTESKLKLNRSNTFLKLFFNSDTHLGHEKVVKINDNMWIGKQFKFKAWKLTSGDVELIKKVISVC